MTHPRSPDFCLNLFSLFPNHILRPQTCPVHRRTFSGRGLKLSEKVEVWPSLWGSLNTYRWLPFTEHASLVCEARTLGFVCSYLPQSSECSVTLLPPPTGQAPCTGSPVWRACCYVIRPWPSQSWVLTGQQKGVGHRCLFCYCSVHSMGPQADSHSSFCDGYSTVICFVPCWDYLSAFLIELNICFCFPKI